MTRIASFLQTVQRSARQGLNVLLPPLCVMCEQRVSRSHGFCGECWRSFTFIAPPLCRCCGLPFEYEGQGLNEACLCAGCLEAEPLFSEARAALVYNEASKKIILPFKHMDRTDYARAMARVMANAGQQMIEKADALMPVPLYFTRLFSRRYNQSALLVHDIAKMTGKPMLLHSLVRRRSTKTQGVLSREQRRKNVHNAFTVRAKSLAQVQGKNLVLVDDVFTTGATAHACVAALKKAGAGRVDVLTFARVVKVNRF